MRILIASESFYPVVSGVSVVAERLAAKLVKRGHTVAVMAPSDDRHFKQEERDGYTIYRIPSEKNPFREDLRFTTFPYPSVRKVLAEVQPEIVHIHDPAALSRTLVFLARRRSIPVVATQHFAFEYILTYVPALKVWHPLIEQVTKRSIYALYNKCAVVTVPSVSLQDQLFSPFLETPITVISNGVDTKRFKPATSAEKKRIREQHSLLSEKLLALYVGRMEPEKNLTLLLDMLVRVPKVHLAFVGAGSKKEELVAQSSELGLENRVHWLEPVPNNDSSLQELYACADVFCIPSPIETESIVTMEAMASGLPVLAARGGALPELIEEGLNGCVLDPEDAAIWAEKLRNLAANPKQREEWGKTSRTLIMKRDVSRSIEAVEALYDQVISDSRSQALEA